MQDKSVKEQKLAEKKALPTVPQAKSLEKIRQGIAKIKGDIDAGMLIDRPVLQYV